MPCLLPATLPSCVQQEFINSSSSSAVHPSTPSPSSSSSSSSAPANAQSPSSSSSSSGLVAGAMLQHSVLSTGTFRYETNSCGSEIAEEDEEELRYDLHCSEDDPEASDEDERLAPLDVPPMLRGLNTPYTYLIPQKEVTDKRLTVVLDLDETLVSNRAQLMWCAENDVLERPHLNTFLTTLAESCEVILWTASTPEVASVVVDTIDPFHQIFEHIIARSPAWFRGVPYTKDLKLLGRPMERVVIVENSVDCVSENRKNAIIVPDFYGTPQQAHCTALLTALEILEEINESARPVTEVCFFKILVFFLGGEMPQKIVKTAADYQKGGRYRVQMFISR